MLEEIQPVVSGLETADRSLQKEKGRSFLLRACPWLLGFILLCFLLDVFLQLPAGPRLLLLGGLGLLCVGVLGWSYYLGHVQRNQMERIARILETPGFRLGLPAHQHAAIAVPDTGPGLERLDSKISSTGGRRLCG